MEPTLLEFDSLPSTNLYLQEHWAELAPFAFVRAKEQTQGKGRGDRVWLSQKGKGLTFSLLLKDPSLWNRIGLVSLSGAVAVASVLEGLGIQDVQIKWPNDVYIAGKKVCGVLAQGQIPSYVALGIGINANETSFEGEYRVAPTSVALSLGKAVDLDAFYGEIVRRLLDLYEGGLDGESLLSYYATHDYLRGKIVSFLLEGERRQGTVQGVDASFGLRVDMGGEEITLASGEVERYPAQKPMRQE